MVCYFCTAVGVALTFLLALAQGRYGRAMSSTDALDAGRTSPILRTLQLGQIMFDFEDISRGLVENWPIWVVSVTLVVAAVIDGLKLKVPNWITFPMIISGWIYSAAFSPYRRLGRADVQPRRHGRRPGAAAAGVRDRRHGRRRREAAGRRRRLGVGQRHAVRVRRLGHRRRRHRRADGAAAARLVQAPELSSG